MILEQGLYTWASANATLTAAAPGGAYSVHLPAECTFPAWTYLRVSTTGIHTHGGATGCQTARVQVTAHAKTHAEACELAQTLETEFNDFQTGTWGTVLVDYVYVSNRYDLGYQGSTETFQVALDVMVQHREA